MATSGDCAVATPHAHVENVLLYLFWSCLYLLFHVLYDELIFLNFRDKLRVFLKLLCKLYCKFQVGDPFLCCFSELACINLLVRLLDDKIYQLFFHMP